MKIEIVPVWKALTPELSAELVAFWNDQNAIRNAAEAGRRSEQVVCIARDAEGAWEVVRFNELPQTLHLPCTATTLTLADIYQGIDFTPLAPPEP